MVLLGIVLLLAASVRLQDLVSHAYLLDEDWSVEIATGRGSLHHHLPVNQIIDTPEFFAMSDAPPFWQIWPHVEVTHPPLYPLLLRGWDAVLGDTDYTGRLFSAIAGLIAVAVLFDTVRLQFGFPPAFWASLLMAIAQPEVEYSRVTRSYTLLTLLAMLTMNLLVRILNQGMSRRRWFLLTTYFLATMMTHYFCVGSLIGLAAWVWLRQREHRPAILKAILLAGVLFALIWGPWMWGQRHLFATDDPSTLFLTGDPSHHVRDTFFRLGSVPVNMLFSIDQDSPLAMVALLAGCAMLLVPLVPRFHRDHPQGLLWSFWLIGGIGVIAALDFSRGTDHLRFVRYTILAGPAVYALIGALPVVSRTMRWPGHVLAALAVISCLIALPQAISTMIPIRGISPAIWPVFHRAPVMCWCSLAHPPICRWFKSRC
jgi:4-amino-4-deoxy-L-arabinose transferase-like glycosyltransferase